MTEKAPLTAARVKLPDNRLQILEQRIVKKGTDADIQTVAEFFVASHYDGFVDTWFSMK